MIVTGSVTEPKLTPTPPLLVLIPKVSASIITERTDRTDVAVTEGFIGASITDGDTMPRRTNAGLFQRNLSALRAAF